MADDRVLDQASAARGDHHGLGSLRLDGEGCRAVGLDQRVDREGLGLHRDRLGVHLQIGPIRKYKVRKDNIR